MGNRRRFEVPNHLQGSDRSVHSHPRSQAFERCHNLEGAFQDHQILLGLGSSYGFQGLVHPLETGGLADTPASSLLSWKNEAHLEGSSVQGHHHIEGNRMRAMPEGNLGSGVAEGNSRQTGQLGGDLYPTVRHVSKTPAIRIQTTHAALQGPTMNVVSTQLADGHCRILVRVHLHERKPAVRLEPGLNDIPKV